MAITPEVPKPQPDIRETQEDFVVPETIQQAAPGIKVVPKNFTAQVKSDSGQTVIQTPPTQVITITPPADDQTLKNWSGGDATNSSTWLGSFWLRIIKKAMLLGWKIMGAGTSNEAKN